MTQGAAYSPIEEEDGWFVGTDKIFKFPIYTDHTLSVRVDINMGFTFRWDVRRDELEDVLITKDATIEDDSQGGLAVITLTPDDTTVDMAGILAHALKRTDNNQEDIVAYGPAVLLLAAAR